MADIEDIFVDNLREALKAAHQYLIWGTSVALFLLILVYQDWKNTGVAAIINLPGIGVATERSIVEVIAGVACFISGYMAYLTVSRIQVIKHRLRIWPEKRKAALTYPSIPTITSGVRLGAVLLPALLFVASLIIILFPLLKTKDNSFIMVMGSILALNVPYILLIKLLWYPLSEKTFVLTEESLEQLKSHRLPDSVLEKLRRIVDKTYVNEEMFVKSLKKTVGEQQFKEFSKLILRYACDEVGIED